MCYYINRIKIFKDGLIMKKIIMISLLALSLCMTNPVVVGVSIQESVTVQKSESQQSSVQSTSHGVSSRSQSISTSASTTRRNTTREVTRMQSTTEAVETTEQATSTSITSTEPSTTTTASENNSVLFGKNKMLSIVAWSLIGIGILFVLIVVLGGKSRRNQGPFQKSTKRYKNKSKYNNYSDKYRSNIKRK